MNTQCQFGNVQIDLQMSDEPVYVYDKGYLHTAMVLSDSNRGDLDILLTKSLWSERILGVESFATLGSQKGRVIGLLLSKQMW